MTKADRLLGRDPNLDVEPSSYASGGGDYSHSNNNTVPMRRLSPRGRTIEQELEDIDNDMVDFDESDEDEEEEYSAETTKLQEQQQQQQQQRPNGQGGPARINSNPSSNSGGWGRGGASGMLRTGSNHGTSALGAQTSRNGGSGPGAVVHEDDDVD
ncbi:hypothetical protein NQ176_g10950 [Zarea fungicola]|uniref:Uncharacterized protein n=1 Tax=Zarea fungicola TaxID=93591 RepID=A0ACC1MCU5_9HYPO|nr:hypothetical protein NQ176_g10950 [Lecanicillium fungicola]